MALRIDDAVKALMRPSAAAMEPYDPGFSPVKINLSANENTYGLPESVEQRLHDALDEVALNRYPVPLADTLREQLATWHGVEPDWVSVGNGGDELLFNFFMAFGGAGRAVLNCPPTFSVYKLYAQLAETPVVDVQRDPVTLQLNDEAMIEAARHCNLVIVTSPNNPTGDVAPDGLVEALCEACPGIVLVDEAYGEFAPLGTTAEPLLKTYKNLAVLHTLSKAYCFAGGRVGYVLAHPSVTAALAAVRQPYSVDVLSQAAASVIVEERHAFLTTISRIKIERDRVYETLTEMDELGVTVWPSAANFLCVRVPGAHEVWQHLRDDYSILVRDFSSTPGLADCLRITIGTPAENDQVLAALAELLGKD